MDLFVFAKWWKADGMLLSSTWARALCAEGHWDSTSLLNNSSLTGRLCEILSLHWKYIGFNILYPQYADLCEKSHFISTKAFTCFQTKRFSKYNQVHDNNYFEKPHHSPFFPQALQKWSTKGEGGREQRLQGGKDQERRWRGKTENTPVTLPSWKVPQGKNVTQPRKV